MSKFNVNDLMDTEKERLMSFVSDTHYLQECNIESDEWLINNGFLAWAGVVNPELLKLSSKGVRAVLDLAVIRAGELEEKHNRKQGAAVAIELFSGRVELTIKGIVQFCDTMQAARRICKRRGVKLSEIDAVMK